jgi:hypothetical protein
VRHRSKSPLVAALFRCSRSSRMESKHFELTSKSLSESGSIRQTPPMRTASTRPARMRLRTVPVEYSTNMETSRTDSHVLCAGTRLLGDRRSQLDARTAKLQYRNRQVWKCGAGSKTPRNQSEGNLNESGFPASSVRVTFCPVSGGVPETLISHRQFSNINGHGPRRSSTGPPL